MCLCTVILGDVRVLRGAEHPSTSQSRTWGKEMLIHNIFTSLKIHGTWLLEWKSDKLRA